MAHPQPSPIPNPVYPLADCASDLNINEPILLEYLRALDRKKQAILYGPPGTGKTFMAKKLVDHLLSEGYGFSEVVQFHPAYTYEDFIQGIRPQKTDGILDYPNVPGRFLSFCQKAKELSNEICVLIIDEINRANLAQVFGELMYLLEYRDEFVSLATGEKFSIPPNVRIIGTMNTADRSIALVDHALRRRFAFLHVAPNYDLLKQYHQTTQYPVEGLIQQLKILNQNIDDHHYEIGPSFFLRSDLAEHLESIWRTEIEPYLEEYFFDQPKKVDQFRWREIAGKL
jgi:5-methylcytosine-specific restriction enzyme B